MLLYQSLVFNHDDGRVAVYVGAYVLTQLNSDVIRLRYPNGTGSSDITSTELTDTSTIIINGTNEV